MLLIKSLPLSEQTYAKNPFSSELGEHIVVEGIRMINRIGLEAFTFRKLAIGIKSTEASVYRYFTSKHMFLVFLSNLYWKWLEERLRQFSYSKDSHARNLENAIDLIVSPVPSDYDHTFPFQELVDVINAEGPKVYLTNAVDHENKEGVFLAYKSLCEALAQLILNVNPAYKFAHSMASTIIESAHDQLFFSKHLPRLTDIEEDNVNQLKEFLLHTVSSAID